MLTCFGVFNKKKSVKPAKRGASFVAIAPDPVLAVAAPSSVAIISACPPSRPSDVGPEGRHWRRAVVEVVGPLGGEAAGGGLVAVGEDCFFGLPLALLAWLGKPASAATPTSSRQHLIAKSHRKIF